MMGFLENARAWWNGRTQIGFEPGRGRQRKLTGEAAPIGPHHPYLGDYDELRTYYLSDEVEAEHVTWPELIDQTALRKFCTAWDLDDLEDDDPAGGDICDEPHDALMEDGI